MNGQTKCMVWGALLWIGFQSSLVSAQDKEASNAELQRRVQQLEAIVQKLSQASQDTQTPPPVQAVDSVQQQPGISSPSAGEGGDVSGFAGAVPGGQDGFVLRSADGANSLRFTGQIQADYRDFLNSRDTVDPDTFVPRRVRFGLEANLAEFYEFRFMPDFGQGKAVINDAYINVHYIDELQFTAGKFKQPVSYEQLIIDRFVPTLERSLIDQVMPARDPGVMIHGQKVLADHLDYAVSLSNGGINGVTGSTTTDLDFRDNFDLNARVVIRPFRGLWDNGILENLQFGVSGSSGIQEGNLTPTSLKTPATITWLTFNNGVQAAGLRTRVVPELSYFFRGLGFAAQYARMDQQMLPSANKPIHVLMDGYMFMATYLLTGEERNSYNEWLTPLHSYDPAHPIASPGAWELVARVSRFDLSDNVFAHGTANLADPTKYSRGATEVTVGFNWYLNRWVAHAIQLRAFNVRYSRQARLGQ